MNAQQPTFKIDELTKGTAVKLGKDFKHGDAQKVTIGLVTEAIHSTHSFDPVGYEILLDGGETVEVNEQTNGNFTSPNGWVLISRSSEASCPPNLSNHKSSMLAAEIIKEAARKLASLGL